MSGRLSWSCSLSRYYCLPVAARVVAKIDLIFAQLPDGLAASIMTRLAGRSTSRMAGTSFTSARRRPGQRRLGLSCPVSRPERCAAARRRSLPGLARHGHADSSGQRPLASRPTHHTDRRWK